MQTAPGENEPESTKGELLTCFLVDWKHLLTTVVFVLSHLASLFYPKTLLVHFTSVHVTHPSFCSTCSSALGRAQRASARNLNAVPSPSDTLVTDGILAESSVLTIPDSDPLAMPIDLESPSLSRSNSAQNLGESSSSTSNGKTKGTRKGKGKQAEKAIVRVKEEEMAPPSLSPDPLATAAVCLLTANSRCLLIDLDMLLNKSSQTRTIVLHASMRVHWYTATGALGHTIYGALILRLRHPISQRVTNGFAAHAPFARSLFIGHRPPSLLILSFKNPPPKPPPSFMSPLILQAQNSGPREYQIPDDIRNFFKDGEVSLDMN